jgi:hypothetical protein
MTNSHFNMPNITPIQTENLSSQEILNICEMLGRAFFEEPFYQHHRNQVRELGADCSFQCSQRLSEQNSLGISKP